MHENEALLPWFTDFYLVIGVFIVALVLCHVLLIFIYPRSAIYWKRVDYVWLSMACIGLVSSVGAGKEVIMKNAIGTEIKRLNNARDHFLYVTKEEAASLVCLKLHRNEATQTELEFKKYQEEFAAQCSWFKVVESYLNALLQEQPSEEFHYSTIYPQGGEQEAYKQYLVAEKIYNDEVQSVRQLNRMSAMTPLEERAKLFGPIVLALALALRITKVTADVEEEKKKRRA
jgi:hypothetical protein